MKMKRYTVALWVAAVLWIGVAGVSRAEFRYNQAEVSAAAVAQATTGSTEGAWEKRKEQEKAVEKSPWAILPHRPNYILPFTYVTNVNEKPLEKASGKDADLDDVEVKFQLSFRIPVWDNMFNSNASLFAAYTQQSLWQAYNESDSSPFRDTNFEPEGGVSFATDVDVLGLRNRQIVFAFAHQSNGRGLDALSRSWNRLYASGVFDRGNFATGLKVWWRLPEDEEDDNNPHIEKYYGYGELRAAYKWGNQVFAGMLRNNLRPDNNKGAIQLDWSFPLVSKLKGYVQFFNGYGECLLDYNYANQRIGVGILLSDWL